MPLDSLEAAFTSRAAAFVRARVGDRAALAGGMGQLAGMIDVRQAGQLWDVLLSFGFEVRGSGSGVAQPL